MRTRPYSRGHVERLRLCRDMARTSLRRQMQAQRREAVRLQQQTPGVGVVDLVVARRFLDEGRLVAVAGVVLDGRASRRRIAGSRAGRRSARSAACWRRRRASAPRTPYDTTLRTLSSSPKTSVGDHRQACAERQCHDGRSRSACSRRRARCESAARRSRDRSCCAAN